VRANRGGIGRRHDSWDDDDRDLGVARPLEQLLVGVVVGTNLGVAHAHRGVGNAVRIEGYERNLCAVVSILPAAPELFVGDV